MNNRNFVATGDLSNANYLDEGDLGPEGIVFIPAKDSPSDEPLLVVANEISGTTTVYEIEASCGDDGDDDDDEDDDGRRLARRCRPPTSLGYSRG